MLGILFFKANTAHGQISVANGVCGLCGAGCVCCGVGGGGVGGARGSGEGKVHMNISAN